jgi:hypothetical protein
VEFPHPFFPTRNRADFTGEPQLAKGRKTAIQRLPAQARYQRQHQREIRRRLADLEPTHQVGEHIMLCQGDARMAAQYRQQHREAPRVEPLCDTTGSTEARGVHQRLNLHEEGAPALARCHDDAARHRCRGASQEDGRRIANLLETRIRHREEGHLVHRAKAVLRGPQQAVATAGVAFEIQHRVDQMLQELRTGDAAILGHMADNEDRRPACLRKAHQRRGALAQLLGRARTRGDCGELHRLDRIDDEERRLPLGSECQDPVEVVVGDEDELGRRKTETPCPQGGLGHGFLATCINDRAILRQPRGHLQQETRLADPRFTAEQTHGTLGEPSAENAIQLQETQIHPFTGGGIGTQRGHDGIRGTERRSRCAGGVECLQGIPGTAVRALTLPFEGLATTAVTDVDGLIACHVPLPRFASR